MSSKKKKAVNPWLQCDDCRSVFSEKDHSSHVNCCPPQPWTTKYSFIQNNTLYSFLEHFKRNDLSLQHVPDEVRSEFCLMSQSALQLCGIPVGYPVIISNEKGVSVVKTAWKTNDKPQLFISLLEGDETINFSPGSLISVEALKQKLITAKEVIIENDTNFVKDSEEILSRLKHTQAGKILCKANSVALSVYGRKYIFRISTIVPMDADNDSRSTIFFSVGIDTLWRFSNSKNPSSNISTLERIGGLQNVIEELEHILKVSLCTNNLLPGIFKTRGVLLHGSSGTGKSLLMRSIAPKMANFVVNIGNEYLNENYESQIESCYMQALRQAPSIITIDDLDVICAKSSSRRDQDRKSVSSLVSVFDRLSSGNELVVIIATARDANLIDKSLRRPGRFDKELELSVPNPQERLDILRVMLAEVTANLSEVEMKMIANGAHGYVGADLLSLVSKAVSLMLLRGGSGVTATDFLSALPLIKPSALKEVLVQVPNVRWSDIGGQDDLKHQLRQAVEWPLKHAESFHRLGISPPRGVLMYGPPGCSKTMIAKALATETGLNFISVKGPELFSKWVGESEKAVREIFRKARQAAPSIVFFDELDALAGERSASSGGSQVQERVLAQLLTEMDGVEALGAVTVVGATNRPDRIDPALLRPGRLDRVVYVPLPDLRTRRDIFQIQFRKTPVAKDVDPDELASLTEGYSGAEVAAVCYEAAMGALDEDKSAATVSKQNFRSALNIIQPRTPRSAIALCENYGRVTSTEFL